METPNWNNNQDVIPAILRALLSKITTEALERTELLCERRSLELIDKVILVFLRDILSSALGGNIYLAAAGYMTPQRPHP